MPKMAQTADNWETGCAMAQMRIKDIAAEAGVSPATVSRYLNNRPGQMTEETRARIAAVIERTGYRPRAAARNLRSSRTNLIGVILADIANPFSSAMLEGLSASAAARGCSLMTAISGNDSAKEAESLTRLIDASVDGLVVNTCGGNDEAIAAAAGRLPVVLLDRDVADGGVDLVTSNNRELVAGLVAALAAAGSERLCLLTEASDDSPVRRERAKAFTDELSHRGLAGEVVTLADGGATGVGRLDETIRGYAGKKLGLIAVSRDCFPRTLSEMRRANIAKACEGGVYECPVTVENEADMLKAVADVKAADCNALVVFLGNFGPETPETLIAKYFEGPCMFVAAAEGDGDLINGRGDAYCGMLNCSYNLGMRHLKGYIPEYPVGTADDIAKMIADFIPIARAVIGVKNLKIITFGPRPQDFFACNAPIKGLYELGVEIEENSELDLLVSYKAHAGDARIPAVCEDMKKEMGEGRYYADMLERMAQFELTLLDWAEGHKGARKYVAFADKCWPAFPEQFGFEPCYVNSRLASRGIPVACEVDIYGALSEYIGACISHDAVTLLDINNSVPASLYEAEIKGKFDYTLTDTFMGFHCGNTPSCKLCADRAVKYQLIQHRLLEPAGSEPDFTRGTLEADIAASDITFYRLQCDSDGVLRSYIAEGEILPVHTGSFGGIGIFAIHEMGRFYRHVLVQKRYPHHGAVAFGHYGKLLFEVFKFLGVGDIAYNQPKSLPYPTENPFA